MTSQNINTRREAEMVLRSACEDSIGLLRELQSIHLAVDGPERAPSESEIEEVLRLRKVFYHVQAITYWPIGKYVLHVIAPDIRAAQEQLDPLTLKALFDGDRQEAAKVQKERERVLGPLSHPTPMTLIYPPHFGGFGDDTLREFLELFQLLGHLVNSYGLALGTVADVLSHSSQPEIVDVIHRATTQLTSVFPRGVSPVHGRG